MGIDIADRIRGALLGTFVGDAMGAPFEGASPGVALDHRIAARLRSPRHLGYTDDTEMMLGLAESLVAMRGFDERDFAQRLRANYEPARGYGRGMKLIFRAMDQGVPVSGLAATAWESGSRGNGAATRAAPLACLRRDDLQRLAVDAERSAALTHAHPHARAACVAQALGIALLLQSGPRAFDPKVFLEEIAAAADRVSSEIATSLRALDVDGAELRRVPPGPLAIESLPVAIRAFLEHPDDFEAALAAALSNGGDTDSIAAMTGALAGARVGKRGIPATWVDALEDGPRGRSLVERLAEELSNR
jgi:poly(ADP-ribose) glycohydrolase ARH3